jgi:hypothetical protein
MRNTSALIQLSTSSLIQTLLPIVCVSWLAIVSLLLLSKCWRKELRLLIELSAAAHYMNKAGTTIVSELYLHCLQQRLLHARPRHNPNLNCTTTEAGAVNL